MVFPGLRKWALQNRWKVGKNRVYGEYNGYYFTVLAYEIPLNVIILLMLFTPEIILDMLPNILLGWLMGFFGVFQLFKAIKQEVDSAVYKIHT